MTIQELQILGFSTEILPSGRLNLAHPHPFAINDMRAYLQVKGMYVKTVESLSSIRKLEQ